MPESYRDSKYVFLANSPPALQMQVLDQVGKDAFVVCDTMNLWIQTAYDDLIKLLGRVNMAVCNDQEARAITQEHSLIKAGRKLIEMGPKIALVKKGEHGAFLFSEDLSGVRLIPLGLLFAPPMSLAIVGKLSVRPPPPASRAGSHSGWSDGRSPTAYRLTGSSPAAWAASCSTGSSWPGPCASAPKSSPR